MNENDLDRLSIAGWERDRFADEATQAIANLPVTDLAHVKPEPITETTRDVTCLTSRLTGGLGVQALYSEVTGDAFITVTLNGKCETFEVLPAQLMDAFWHPFVYGATLDL